MTDREALQKAAASLAAIADLLSAYPRPSQDPNGRILLDAREHAIAAAQSAKQQLEAPGAKEETA